MNKDTSGSGTGKRPQGKGKPNNNAKPKNKPVPSQVKNTASKMKSEEKNSPKPGKTSSGKGKQRPEKSKVSGKTTAETIKIDNDTEYLKALPPPKRPANPFLVSLKRFVLGVVAVILVLTIFIVILFTVFFKVDEISVEGETRYNTEDIIKESLINYGDSLISCSTAKGEENIYHKFPYIEEVSIGKQLFSKINISVKEAVPAAMIESNGKYVVLSEKGKIIEVNDKKIYEDIPTVLGAKLTEVTLSSQIKFEDANLKKYLEKIFECIKAYSITNIQTLDITDTSAITLIKKNGFKIILGNFEEIDYKLKTASTILSKNVKDDAKGRLDVSLATPKTKKSFLKLGEEVSKVSVPEKSSVFSSKSSAESSKSAESSEESSEESTEESPNSESAEPADDGGNDDGGYDDGGNDDGGNDDGGNDDSGYDDGGNDDGGNDDGGNDDGGNDDGGYDYT